MATSVIAPVTPAVLVWARKQAAVSVAELANRVKVKPERVVEWESGHAAPTVAMLRSIADMLKQPMAFFFAPSPPKTGVATPPDFRGAGSQVSRVLTREIKLAEERRDIFKRLAPDVVAESAWPSWTAESSLSVKQVRSRLGVSVSAVAATKTALDALKLWIAAMEDQDILVFQMSRVGNECSGFSLDDPTTPVIVLNGAEAPQRRVFTLLHEFGHLLHHSGGLCALDENSDEERACNRFAESVLMPPAELRAALGGASGSQAVDAVERKFRVSRLAAAVALRRQGLIGQAVVDAEKRRSDEAEDHRSVSVGGPPPERLKRRNLGDRYLTTVLDAMDSDVISVADATYYLGAKINMIGKLESALVGSNL